MPPLTANRSFALTAATDRIETRERHSRAVVEIALLPVLFPIELFAFLGFAYEHVYRAHAATVTFRRGSEEITVAVERSGPVDVLTSCGKVSEPAYPYRRR